MRTASFEQREWIDPWRDRRPMTDDMVLVTYWFGGKMFVDTSRYTKGHSNLIERWTVCGTVLAWQPLPEAYDPVAEAE